jgi:signal transduction histidine kinase
MTRLTETPTQALVARLEAFHAELAAAWTEIVDDTSTAPRGEHWLERLRLSTDRGVSALTETLAGRGEAALDAYLGDLGRALLALGIASGEAAASLLLIKEAAWQVFGQRLAPAEVVTLMPALDVGLRQAVSRFSTLYAAELNRQLSDQLAENEALRRVTAALLGSLDLEQVMAIVCNETRRLTGALGSAVYFLDQGCLRLVHSEGEHPEHREIRLDNSLAGEALRTGQLQWANDPASDPRVFRPPSVRVPPVNLAVAPLCAGGRPLGVLYSSGKAGGYDARDRRLMEGFANQAAVALEHARLHRQVGQVAVLEERERLAREMHDNVAQALSALRLHASAIGDLLAAGEYPPAQAHLAHLTQAASQAHADVREAIFSLRHSPGTSAELLPALRAHVERYRVAAGLAVTLAGDEAAVAGLDSPAVVQVTRIIQEALTNVRKHAHAQHVSVRLEQEDGWLRVTIDDDGCGFDPAALEPGRGGVGLQVMRERAESLGGSLDVASQPGAGTRIVARVPRGERG